MPPGEYRLRVRAWRDEAPGEWSEERPVSVPPLLKPVERRPPVAPPRWRIPLRVGYAAAALIFIVLAVLAGLTLPENGPLRRLVFGPTPTWTPTPTEVPAGTESPVETPIPQPTRTPMGIESPPPTPPYRRPQR
jgi:hypothetical protein